MPFRQSFEHEFGSREEDHGLAVDLAGFVVSHEPPVVGQSSEGALDDPAVGRYGKAFHAGFGADDFHAQAAPREPLA